MFFKRVKYIGDCALKENVIVLLSKSQCDFEGRTITIISVTFSKVC